MDVHENIMTWDPRERPRERLMAFGAAALPEAELLAILIGSGNQGESAVALMQRILADYNNDLNSLSKCDIDQLCSYKGIGEAKAITILAATELGRRRNVSRKGRVAVRQSRDIFEAFQERLMDKTEEEFWMMCLNASLMEISRLRISSGGWTQTTVDIRVIMREALLRKAVHIALCHNHPSGNATPSAADKQLTEKVKRACREMDINLIDHVIVADSNYYSFADEGMI